MRRVLSIIAALVLLAAAGSTVLANDKEVICHPVNGKGETKTGYSIVDVSKMSIHFDKYGNPKHESKDGQRVDVLSKNGLCPGQTEATPTPTPIVDPTPVVTPVVTPSDQPSESPRNEVPNTAMSDDRPLNISLFGWIAGGIFIIMGVVYALTMAQKPRK